MNVRSQLAGPELKVLGLTALMLALLLLGMAVVSLLRG